MKFQKGNTLHRNLSRTSNGKFVGKGKVSTLSVQSPKPGKTQVAIVVDRSGSMDRYQFEAEKVVNDTINQFKADAHKLKLDYGLTIVQFDSETEVVGTPGLNPNGVPPYKLVPRDSTNLHGAVMKAIEELQKLPAEAYLVMVITDGLHNTSPSNSAEYVQNLRALGMWTFSWAVPVGMKSNIVKEFGESADNVLEFETTKAGLTATQGHTVSAVTTYGVSRSKGNRNSSIFYSNVNQGMVSILSPVPGTLLEVKKEAPISDFVESKLGTYPVGRVYYELMKPEKVQPHKDLLLVNKLTKKIYGGDVEYVLSIPTPRIKDIRIKPGDHANYKVMVQSTSFNRILPRGTTVLVRS